MSVKKFCKRCGKQISKDFKLCPYCGEKVEEEILEIPCQFCGKTIKSDFKVCPYCENNLNSKKENYNDYNNHNTENRAVSYSNNYEVSSKSGIACLLLWFFLGSFGVHRFYAGKIGSGFIMLILFVIFIIFIGVLSELSYYSEAGTILAGLIVYITAITLTIWWIIDLVSILRGKFKDSKGRYIKIRN